MTRIVLLGSLLLAAGPLAPTLGAGEIDDRYKKKAAEAQASRQADAHVDLALWCEAHGLKAERLKQLALALQITPNHGKARGLLGQVACEGRWVQPENHWAKRLGTDPGLADRMAEYHARRTATPNTAGAQWELGRWCEQQGLKAEALAHFTVVTRLAPDWKPAWVCLGYENVDESWMTPAQRAAAEAEAKAQTEADKKWSFSLETWYRRSLGTGPKAAEAEAHLAQVNDPRAVPRIRKDFLKKRNPEEPRRYQVAARLLAQIDGSEAGDVLVNLAFFGPTEAVQNEAAELLPTCTPSNVVGPLIDLVHAPSRYRRISDFELRVEGEYGIDQTRYEPHVGTNSEATGAEIEAAHQASIRDAKSRLETRIAEIKRNNLKILRMNARIRPILRRLTGIDLRDDREAWKVWWADAQGYAYSPPPPQTTIRSESVSVTPYHPCFGAGTLVRTQTGLAPIEDLAVGDQVLVQDTATGVLSFQPIVATTHCPPAPTLRVILKDDVLIATGIHRFWRPGRGWALARDLKPGESVRILGGLAQVTAVEPAPMQPVFSLMVAAGRSFFVGHTGALARDDSPPEPASPPFDAVPTPEISAPHTN